MMKSKVKSPKQIIINDKVWTKESIHSLVMTNDQALAKMLIHLFNKQTRDEKADNNAKFDNYVGFNKPDSFTLGIAAKFIIKNGIERVSPNYMAYIKTRISKYSRQMWEITLEQNGK